jgi:hydroxypyruvate reductase
MAAFAGLPTDADVALVGGGEADLAVPAGSPVGGRAQHAALLAARHLGEHPQTSDAPGGLVLCAATDGKDGSTDAAGAWVTAADWLASPNEARRAVGALDAHAYLRDRKRLVHTGPTGTNMNDVWIALRRAS